MAVRTDPTARVALILAGIAGLGATLATIVHFAQPRPGQERTTDSGLAASVTSEPRGRPSANTGPVTERGTARTADLRALLGGDGGARQALAEAAARQGVVDSPGTDPRAARLEVSQPGWAERHEAELRAGIAEVVGNGARLDRLECLEGRCLVELSFDSMSQAQEKRAAIRGWLERSVRCPGHTDGPEEADGPSVRTSQQIWILCGSPDGPAVR